MSSLTETSPSIARTALILVPGGVLALLSVTVVGVALPPIAEDLHATVASAQWVTTAYLLASAVGIPLGAWTITRFGMRRSWIAALALFAAGGAFAALAPQLGVLVVIRVAQGLGGGALEPMMLTALARAAGPARMGRVMGSVAAAMSLGPLLGPLLGGIVVQTIGWRWTFAGSAAIAVVILIASFVVLRDDERHPAPLDLVGLLLLSFGTIATLYGLTRIATDGVDPLTVGAIVAGLGTLVLFSWRSVRRAGRAFIELDTFRARGFTPAVVIMALVGASVYPLFFGLPQFFQGVWGFAPSLAGALLVPYAVGTLVAMPVTGRLSDTMGARHLVQLGALLAAAGFALLIAVAGAQLFAVAIVATLLIGLGIGSVGSPTVSALYRVLEPKRIPAGSTILFIVNQLGGALGIALMAALIGRSTSWDAEVGATPLWLPVGATVAIALIAFRLPSRRKTPA